MIREIQIENFKSIKNMKLELGRINVFIGENGSGKSNVLEAIALAGAAAANKLDNEFLASRGIRAAEPRHMRSAFDGGDTSEDISVSVSPSNGIRLKFNLSHDGRPYSNWTCASAGETSLTVQPQRLLAFFEGILAKRASNEQESQPFSSMSIESLTDAIAELRAMKDTPAESEDAVLLLKSPSISGLDTSSDGDTVSIRDFVIYSPENVSLRIFRKEGQIEPLGIQGEGLLKFLQVLNENPEYREALASIRSRLTVLGWFEDLSIPDSRTSLAAKIEIRDRYLREEAGCLDQISANEGFLFLLFYFCLFSTDLTPRFFAIDNVDASLNPKLCAHLVTELAKLARTNDKQAILTTHNPATLDGLDLNDDEQRLFVISRGDSGETKIRRIRQKKGNATDVKLSTAFINGYLGGLPRNF